MAAAVDPGVSAVARGQVLYRAAIIMATKGGTLDKFTVRDVLELFDAQAERLASSASDRVLFYRLVHQMGSPGRR